MLKIKNNRLILSSVWIIILLLSIFLFCNSLYFVPSIILLLTNVILCIFGLYYAIHKKNLYFMSPILLTIYSIMYYITVIGLFYFSKYNDIIELSYFKVPSNDTGFLVTVCCLYLLQIICLLLPYFYMIIKKNTKLFFFKFLKRNFNFLYLKYFLLLSQILLIILFILLFVSTGFSPMQALFMPIYFRNACMHGFANYIFVIFTSFILLHLVIVLKLLILDKQNDFFIKSVAIIFFMFYFIWALTSGARAWYVIFFLYSVYIYSLKSDLKISLKTILSLVFAFFIMLLFCYGCHVYRNIQDDIAHNRVTIKSKYNLLSSSIERDDDFASSFNYFVYLERNYGSILNYNDFALCKQWKSQFTNVIPRELLPDKNFPISAELTKIIYPQAWNGNVTILFGGLVNSYYTFGIVGVILDALLLGIGIAILEGCFHILVQYDMFQIFYILLGSDLIIDFFYTGYLNTSLSYKLIFQIIFLSFILSLLTKRKFINKHKRL